MAVQAWFDRDDREVTPGSVAVLTLTVEHLDERVTTYAITPTGLAAGWTTVTRPTLVCTAQDRERVEVEIHPPRSPGTAAGATTIAVRVVPVDDPDGEIVAEATVRVEAYADRRVSLLQPAVRTRRRATFEMLVENHGNELASCRLHLVDPTGRVDGSFDPPAIGVPAGESSLVRLRAHAVGRRLRARERQLEFAIEATQPDHVAATGHAALIQPPTVPGRLIGGIATVALVVGAAALAWFGVVRPEIRDAADRAVTDRITEVDQVADTTTGDDDPAVADQPDEDAQVPDITTAPAPDPSDDRGVAFLTRLQVAPGPDATSADDHLVPDGRRLEITDVVVQNRTADVGWVSLSVDDQVLYEWDLALLDEPNQFQPRIAPIPVAAGQRLVLRSTCEVVGDPALGTCDVALLLGGRSFAA